MVAFVVVVGIQSSFPALFSYPLALLILIAIPLTLLVRPVHRRFGEEAALAREKTRLLAEQKKRAAQLQLASSIAAQLSDTQDPQTIMQQVVERIGKVFGYHVVGIMLVDDEARELQIRAAHGLLANREGSPYRQSIDQGILGMVVRTGKPYLAPDVTRDPYYFYPIPGDDPVRSELAVPLRQNGRVTGVLDLQSTEPNAFDASDVAAMEILAEQLAAALTRGEALTQEKKRAAHLALVSEIAAHVMAMDEPQAILQTMVQLVQERFGYHHVCVSLLDSSRDELELRAIAGPNAQYYRIGERWKTDRGLIGMAARTRDLVVSNDVKSDPRFVPDSDQGDANSELCIPLTSHQTVLGVLDIETTTRNGFSVDDTTALTALANQIAAALDKAHSLERERRRAAQLELVNRIASRIARLSPIDQLLPDLVSMIHDQFGYINVAVFLQQPNTVGLTLFANAGPLGTIDRHRVIIDNGIIGHVRKTAQLYLCQDADHDPFYYSPYPQRESDPTRSELALPLRRGETLSGVLDIQSEVVGAFDESDVTALQVLADQISETLENARLYAAAATRARELQALNEASRLLNQSLDVPSICQTSVESLYTILGYSHVSIYFVQGDVLKLQVERGYANVLDHIPLEQGVMGRAVRTRQITFLPQVSEEPRFLAAIPGIQSEIAIPLLHGDRALGVLNVETIRNESGTSPDHLTQADVQLLSTFANQLVVAIENGRLYEQSKRDAEVKTALLRELSHRVKNNLAAITSLLYLALDEPPESREKILSETLGRVQSMGLAHTLLARSERARVNLIEMGRQVLVDTVRQLGVPGSHIEIVVQGAPVEVAARQTTTLALVLNELATNSLRHGFSAGTYPQQGVIRFSVWRDDEMICLELEDNGQGLPPDFDLEATTGLGLNLIRTLVEKDLHGKFELRCERQATRAQIRFRLEE